LFLFWDGLANRSGAPSETDVWAAVIGIALLLEAARRSLGFPLMAVAAVFLAYVFFGSYAWLPDVIQWRGASVERAMSHMWLTTEGVFGVALGVSSGFVFLFVLFGALLNQAGAGNYFLSLAFATLGHLRGGPAKAAVIASAATGSDLGLVDRQRRDDRHLHHSADEDGWAFRPPRPAPSRCRRRSTAS
jgi:TRAP-type uncharacterized transport system fused permease subunit